MIRMRRIAMVMVAAAMCACAMWAGVAKSEAIENRQDVRAAEIAPVPLDENSSRDQFAGYGMAKWISDQLEANGGTVNILFSASNAAAMGDSTPWLTDWGITSTCVMKVDDGREAWRFEST